MEQGTIVYRKLGVHLYPTAAVRGKVERSTATEAIVKWDDGGRSKMRIKQLSTTPTYKRLDK